jgi:transcriptional regulator GlxA family with amidase domain
MPFGRRGSASTAETAIARFDSLVADWREESPRIPDLARAAGVSTRTVYRVFARRCGAPPITHLRRERLQRVREQLLAGGSAETVTSVALDWGFTHLGRFAAYYESCYGERPSETLRRARENRQVRRAPLAESRVV